MEVGKAIAIITIFEEEIMFKYMHCNASISEKKMHIDICIDICLMH